MENNTKTSSGTESTSQSAQSSPFANKAFADKLRHKIRVLEETGLQPSSGLSGELQNKIVENADRAPTLASDTWMVQFVNFNPKSGGDNERIMRLTKEAEAVLGGAKECVKFMRALVRRLAGETPTLDDVEVYLRQVSSAKKIVGEVQGEGDRS